MLPDAQKIWQRVPELEKSTAVAVEKMKLEEGARRKLEERLIMVRSTILPASAATQIFVEVLTSM